jgi:threonine/homoserine/homoserine lactone efflux protein
MLIFGATIIYGGLGYFIWVAIKAGRYDKSAEKSRKVD